MLRRLDPAFAPEPGDDAESWEPRGTQVGGSYRDSMPTIPSPEALEAQLLAKLTEPSQRPPAPEAVKPAPEPVKPAPMKPGARAQFEPPHAPAVSAAPIIELEKAAAIIVDPFAIASRPLVAAAADVPEAGTSTSTLSVSVAVDLAAHEWGTEAEANEAALAARVDVAHDLTDSDDGEVAPEVTERSRITVPPARRRHRRWRAVKALCLGALVLGGVAAAAWYRYPAQFEQGYARAQTELPIWRGALEHYFARGLEAIRR